MPGTNYLLGYGERLTERVDPPRTNPSFDWAYGVPEARARVTKMLATTSVEVDALPDLACPLDETVIAVTLHPRALAKSHFPRRLLREARLSAVGSKSVRVTPEKDRGARRPKTSQLATQLYVQGARHTLREISTSIAEWSDAHPGADDLPKIEIVRSLKAAERLKDLGNADAPFVEACLHNPDGFVLEGLDAYLKSLDLRADFDRRLQVGYLCFLPMQLPREAATAVAQFSFVRVIRQLPTIRPVMPIVRQVRGSLLPIEIPQGDVLDPSIRVAIIDGGFSSQSPLAHWVNYVEDDVGPALPEFIAHGTEVTSAFLLGTLDPEASIASWPYATVDNIRVLDEDSATNPYVMFDVLKRIRKVLETRRYEFVNLSIGPTYPVDDDDVHPWTAALDELFAHGDTVVTAAVGNITADEPDDTRVQVPCDAVNLIAVGAANSEGPVWDRAWYSRRGPGRSPGFVKPDVVAFGGSGSVREPFWVLGEAAGVLVGQNGTSFASPSVLRLTAAMRAHFGDQLSPLALRALLVHGADRPKRLSVADCGWGRIPGLVEDLVVCDDGEVRVVYQGTLRGGQFMRMPIPLPPGAIEDALHIKATFCISSLTNPEDPSNYTCSGLDIRFRPNDEELGEGGTPKTKVFFRLSDFASEEELRRDAHKWETTLSKRRRFNKPELMRNPCFDVHYCARDGGASVGGSREIRYAAVISLQGGYSSDMYNRVVRAYASRLEVLTPRIEVPLTVR